MMVWRMISVLCSPSSSWVRRTHAHGLEMATELSIAFHVMARYESRSDYWGRTLLGYHPCGVLRTIQTS